MSYKKLVWAFILMFDFRINKFDIFPDFIGYLLFLIGLLELQGKNEYFKKAKNFSLVMIPLSLGSFYDFKFEIEALYSEPMGLLFLSLSILCLVLKLLMIYNICKGIGYESTKQDNESLKNIAQKRWNLYLGNLILLSSLGVVSLFFEVKGIVLIFFIPAMIFSLIVFTLMIDLMNMAAVNLE